jgi:putative transposase
LIGIVSLAGVFSRGSLCGMNLPLNPYRGFRFPREIIQHAVWLYH